jgi:hypothetical protein
MMLAAILAIAAVPICTATPAAAQDSTTPQRKPDLGDTVAGTYEGDVISDSRGSSQSGVTITVERVGKNLVRVSSDYPRIPTVTIPLTQAMTAIIAAKGDSVFLIDRAKDPRRLDLTIDGASLSVTRQ